jgi:5-methylcytosine-specific restriction enzyme A
VTHFRRERRGSARKKRAVLSEKGRLACEVCAFDFEATYGPLGEALAECHHKRPLTEGVRQTSLSDLAIVCANCHRMIHRSSPPLAIEELQALIS